MPVLSLFRRKEKTERLTGRNPGVEDVKATIAVVQAQRHEAERVITWLEEALIPQRDKRGLSKQ